MVNNALDIQLNMSPETRQLLDQFDLQNVCSHLLRRAHFVAEERFAQVFAGEQITPRQKAALIIVYQRPGLNQNALADELAMDRNTVAEMVKRLITTQLLRRSRAENDKRAYQLYLTADGARLLDRVILQDHKLEHELLETLPAEYRPLFIKCLRLLINQQPKN